MSEESGDKLQHIEYRDSRRAAWRVLYPGRTHGARRFVLSLLVAAGTWWLWTTVTASLPPAERAVLFLFILAVGLWITEAVPSFAVGLLIMGYLVFVLGTPWFLEEPMPVQGYVDTFSSPVVWLILGGFFMAEGMARTGLDRRLFALAIGPAGNRPRNILLAVMLTSAIASMFISNTSTTALLITAVLPFTARVGEEEPFSRALLVAIPFSATVGGMGTIIGSAPNAIAVGIAANSGSTVNFVEWMLIGVPVAIGMVLLGWRFILWRYPTEMEHVAVELGSDEPVALPERRARWLVAGITATTIGLWLTTPLHGVPVAVISLVPIVGLSMTQVLGTQQVRSLPWDTLMLVAGGLSLGAAVVDTGLADRMALGLSALTGIGFQPLIFLIMALLTVVLSNFMSNTATVSLILPVAVALLPGRELEMCLILGLSASCALLLPVSTPPNAVAFATGRITTADLRPIGIAAGLLGPLLIVTWVLLLSGVVR
ncbi:MAG: DASS family sodium-coupled anion symporter [Pseudomonadota bacterium]